MGVRFLNLVFINFQIEEVSVFLTDVWYSFNLKST